MDLKESLLRGIYGYGFEKPSAIQQRAIMPCIEGKIWESLFDKHWLYRLHYTFRIVQKWCPMVKIIFSFFHLHVEKMTVTKICLMIVC